MSETVGHGVIRRAADRRGVEYGGGDDCGCQRICAMVESMQARHRKRTTIFEGVTIADVMSLGARRVGATAQTLGRGPQ